MFIKITPFDTLFFRTGRPFSAGTDTWTETVFPPSPSTFYGAIRSYLIFNYGTLEQFISGKHKLKNVLGEIENKKISQYGSLQIKGIYLNKNKIYFPIPKDVIKIKKEKDKLRLLTFKEKPKLFLSNYNNLSNVCIWDKPGQVEDGEGWLAYTDFFDYLKANKSEFTLESSKKFFEKEQKIGIKRSRVTFTSEEGYLYRIPFIRLNKDVSILVEIEDLKDNLFTNIGIFQLGGEGKVVKFEVIKQDPLNDIKDLNFEFKNGYFKVYFATPAVFKNGWYPEWIDKSNLEGNYNGIKVKLVACVLGKPVSIGGWDLANQKPKPMRRVVPAGSVYYFKILNSANAQKVKEVFHFKNISDDFEDIKYSKEGFGLAILGEVKL